MIIPPAVDARRIRAAMAGHVLGVNIETHEEITSTSDHARMLGEAGHPHGTVIFAESQTAGRGRRENKWSAEPRHSLLFSALLRPDVPMEKLTRLATLAAYGLSRAVESFCGLVPQIKWPNDLLLRDKKFCGILCEMFASPQGPFVVLGVGLNVNTTAFSDELKDTATSLRLEWGNREVDRTSLAVVILQQMESALASWDAGFEHVLVEVRNRSRLLGRRIRAVVRGTAVEGQAVDLDADGALVISRDDGSREVLQSVEQVRAI